MKSYISKFPTLVCNPANQGFYQCPQQSGSKLKINNLNIYFGNLIYSQEMDINVAIVAIHQNTGFP